jgi:hypothetical protein
MTAFDPKDIPRILERCVRFGVTRFKLGELEIEFGGVPVTEIPTRARRAPERPEAQAEVEAELHKKRELELRDEQIENMLLTDPEEHEKLIAAGELQDAEAQH